MERIRDEAHRFAIKNHRIKRGKKLIENPLDGIGASRRKFLLQYFGSSSGVSGAGIDDICQVEGISKKMAKIIYDHFNK